MSFEKRRRELRKKQERADKVARKQDGDGEKDPAEFAPEQDEGYFPVDDAVPEHIEDRSHDD